MSNSARWARATTESSRRETVYLVVLSCLAAVLAFVHLGSKSLWFDEAYTYELTQEKPGPLLHVLWHQELPNALHVALLRPFTALFGTSEAALRTPSALFAIATIPFAFRIARRFLSFGMAVVAALFVVLNGYFFTYAQEARSYELAILLTTAALVAALRMLEQPTFARTGVWAATAAIATYAHFYAGFMFAGQFVAFLLVSRSGRRLSLGAAAAAAYALLIAPILAYLVVAETIRTQLGQPGIHDLAAIVAAVAGDGGPLLTLAATGLSVLGALAIVRRFRGLAPDERAKVLTLYLSLVAPGILALAYGRLVTPDIERRYFAVCVVPMMIAAAIGVNSLGRRARVPAAAVMIALLGWSIHQAYARPKDDWRGAARFLVQNYRQGDGIAFEGSLARTPLRYYLLRTGAATRLTPVRPPQPLRELTLRIPDYAARNPIPASGRVWVACGTQPSCRRADFAGIAFGPGRRGTAGSSFHTGTILILLETARK